MEEGARERDMGNSRQNWQSVMLNLAVSARTTVQPAFTNKYSSACRESTRLFDKKRGLYFATQALGDSFLLTMG